MVESTTIGLRHDRNDQMIDSIIARSPRICFIFSAGLRFSRNFVFFSIMKSLIFDPYQFSFLFMFTSFYVSPAIFTKKSLFPCRNVFCNFFLNLRNHMFFSCTNFLVPLSWRSSPCPEDDAPPQEGDRPRPRSQSSFAFFLLTSRSY